MVPKIECPDCEQLTFSWWNKQMLWPARAISCPNCGARISLDAKRHRLVSVAIFGAVIILGLFSPQIWDNYGRSVGILVSIAGWTLIGILIGLYVHRYVPLVIRSKSSVSRETLT